MPSSRRSPVNRFFRTFFNEFLATMRESRLDKIILAGTIIYIVLRGLLTDRWEFVAGVIWGLCALVVVHAFGAAEGVRKEIREESIKGVSGFAPAASNTTRSRLYPVQLYGLAVVILVLCAWTSLYVWQRSQAAMHEVEGFRVVFKTEYIDMSRSLNNSMFWVVYRGTFGDTASPVALLAFLDVTSLYAHPVSISSYALAVKSESCGWTYLLPLDARALDLLWMGGAGEPLTGGVINTKGGLFPAFSYQWEKPVEPREAKSGVLLFDTNVKCEIPAGSTIQFKLELTDSTGKTFPCLSPNLVVEGIGSGPGESSVQDARPAVLDFIGVDIDLSKAHRKSFSDPNRETKDTTVGVIQLIVGGKKGRLEVGPGVFNYHSDTPPR